MAESEGTIPKDNEWEDSENSFRKLESAAFSVQGKEQCRLHSRIPKHVTDRPQMLVFSEEESWELAKEFAKRFSQGFCSGVGIFSGVRIVTALLRNPFRKSIPVIWKDIMSRDCVAVAGFLGLYPSVYHLLLKLLIRIRGCKDGWNYGIAGGVGGLSVALLDSSRRQTLAFFTLSRALGAGISTLVTRDYLRSIPFFEVWVFSACVSLIVYCTALAPQYLNRGYYMSILKWSRDYTDSNLTLTFREPGSRFLTCSEVGLHEGSCTAHRLKDLLLSLPGFAKLYLPIHLTPVLIFKRAMLMKRPLFVLYSLAKNLALSTLFLGLMVSLAKMVICLLRNAMHRPPPLAGFIPALAGAVCGLALLLERFSRRKELTLFVIPHVLNILYVAGQSSSLLKPFLGLSHGFTLVFALSMSSIMHAYEREPQSLTLLINGIIRFFFGPRREESKKSTTQKTKLTNQSGHSYSKSDEGDSNTTVTESPGTFDINRKSHVNSSIRFEDIIKILH